MAKCTIFTLAAVFVFVSGSYVMAAYGGSGHTGTSSSYRSQSGTAYKQKNTYQNSYQHRYQEQQDSELQQQQRSQFREQKVEDSPAGEVAHRADQDRFQLKTQEHMPETAD
ncbi:MAG: hypothetical protein C0623_10390 [Desulfuromonas sp.]|nr:MAG: hypothetical protein C0623_10390 [Desulfuromonas sp.]